ncbi:MAG: trypsin-like peptidase domain-containing protein [Candidatus Kapabacteria bacterium]|nr:trypsin-like peptidase domain-containing protein [Candidatus Kapabacteria bacterium]
MKKYILLFLCLTNLAIISQPSNIKNVIKTSLSSVVLINTDFGLGSGVIITLDGYILTNFHVIEQALQSKTSIKVTTHNKDEYYAQIVNYDDDLDLCLLKTPYLSNETSFVIVKPDSINVGDDIICIGNPLGISEYVTKGIVSKYTTPYVFISANINPGNSGGAMINLSGELVGIPTLTLTNTQNINMAICPRTIRYFLKKNKINFKEK